MTRDFNKPRRDGTRPPSRNTPSNRNGEERSSNPARPRLNREMVDRAWENGATRTHADYHPRSSNGQPQSPRTSWRRDQNSNSSQQTPGGRKPYGPRQDNYSRSTDRPYSNQQGPRSRPFNSNGAETDRPGLDNRRSFSDNPRGRQEDRPFQNRGSAPRGQGGSGSRPFQGRGSVQKRGYSPRDAEREISVERGQDKDAPEERSFPAREQGGRPFQGRGDAPRPQGGRPFQGRGDAPRPQGGRPFQGRSDAPRPQGSRPFQGRGDAPRPGSPIPGTRGAARHERPERPPRNPHDRGRYERRSALRRSEVERPPNPRYLTRPEVLIAQDKARDKQRLQEYNEQFLGDYEQFDEDETPQQHGSQRKPRYENEQAERHVTKLPDGRVLKGSRPAQRKNAQFWTDIDADTGKLVEQIQVPEEEAVKRPPRDGRPPRRPIVGRGKGAEKKPRTKGPRPSHKGFKWPDQPGE